MENQKRLEYVIKNAKTDIVETPNGPDAQRYCLDKKTFKEMNYLPKTYLEVRL